ncbi:hypothetical protein OGH69_11630 [Flavobacterium sp. MFBS3-15]|uniref:hypothetical protein n=1 Tax=Flavobacterium sp. MFBS3-15 TaxID=2989816 RepID=UPI00223560D1|nr:hypothetical protein [Flavobacterium sp. MFBS3-15]MCW4469620.1 hypothetical protein [Flavobacterium sp. MFBS3-15]
MEDYKSPFSEQTSSFDSFEMQLTNDAKDFLRSAAGWAMAFAIIGFIGCGFLLLATLALFAAGGEQNGMPTGAIALLYLVMTVMYFLPMLFLLKFSTASKRALDENNTQQLIATFKNLKNHFMMAVISVIVIIISSIVFGVIIVASAASQF